MNVAPRPRLAGSPGGRSRVTRRRSSSIRRAAAAPCAVLRLGPGNGQRTESLDRADVISELRRSPAEVVKVAGWGLDAPLSERRFGPPVPHRTSLGVHVRRTRLSAHEFEITGRADFVADYLFSGADREL